MPHTKMKDEGKRATKKGQTPHAQKQYSKLFNRCLLLCLAVLLAGMGPQVPMDMEEGTESMHHEDSEHLLGMETEEEKKQTSAPKNTASLVQHK